MESVTRADLCVEIHREKKIKIEAHEGTLLLKRKKEKENFEEWEKEPSLGAKPLGAGPIYDTGLSRSKFAGALSLVVEVFLRGA